MLVFGEKGGFRGVLLGFGGFTKGIGMKVLGRRSVEVLARWWGREY